jgi:hypothetical protein
MKSVFVKINGFGEDVGDYFLILADIGGAYPSFASKSDLLNGITIVVDNDLATKITIMCDPIGVCKDPYNNIQLIIDGTTTTTTTLQPTTTTTTLAPTTTTTTLAPTTTTTTTAIGPPTTTTTTTCGPGPHYYDCGYGCMSWTYCIDYCPPCNPFPTTTTTTTINSCELIVTIDCNVISGTTTTTTTLAPTTTTTTTSGSGTTNTTTTTTTLIGCILDGNISCIPDTTTTTTITPTTTTTTTTGNGPTTTTTTTCVSNAPLIFYGLFTPNNDGYNDKFVITNAQCYLSRFTVYNSEVIGCAGVCTGRFTSWSNLPVYISTGYYVPWDGSWNMNIPTGHEWWNSVAHPEYAVRGPIRIYGYTFEINTGTIENPIYHVVKNAFVTMIY